MKGRFITVEGTEGVGKSTNLAFIEGFLRSQAIDVITTREPGGTPLAEELRELLLAKRDEPVDASAELLMVFAARAQHLNQLVAPALARGQWVLCDRFTDATYAYQGAGRGLSLEAIGQLEFLVQGSLQPDMTVWLDIDVRLGLERARARADLDRFEEEDVSFFERVRAGYRARAEADPARFCRINAAQPLVQVQADIQRALEAFM